MIRYQITSQNPATHYFNVKILIDNPAPSGQVLRLPNWIPGSYMIRDFARHLNTLQASSNNKNLDLTQIAKSSWQVEPCLGPLTIEYIVYSRDLSVRGAHLDHTHGYYNGTSVFLEVVGQAAQACEVLIEKPSVDYCHDWRLATSLARKQAEEFGFGLYQAESYDDLIDHPVEMGLFRQIRFEACGVPHDIILSGRFSCDEARLQKDLTTICEHHIRFFGEPAPVDYYQFQVLVVGDGYGGLEHRASTSLMASRDSLPQIGDATTSDAYRDFLGLCSHEYFHTWNIKRIKPAVFEPYELQDEVYTELLWAFEGITSYYDDLALLRCGLIEPVGYLELLAQTMTRVARGKGSKRQSAAESSFNTWTKFYKQDENAQNAIVSYYAKGCLIALCIDLKMRSLSQQQKSLDDVMQVLWTNWKNTGEGVEEQSIQRIISDIMGSDLGDFLHQMIHQTSTLPLVDLLAEFGIELKQNVASHQADRGGKVAEGILPQVALGAVTKEQADGLRILRLDEAGSAQTAGLSADDIIVAVNGLKLNQEKLNKLIKFARVGDQWSVHAFRRDELHCFELTLLPAAEDTVVLTITDQQKSQRLSWFGVES